MYTYESKVMDALILANIYVSQKPFFPLEHYSSFSSRTRIL